MYLDGRFRMPQRVICQGCNHVLYEGSELDKARDYFLFSFNMRGMSFVDMAFLKNSDVVEGRLLYARRKTSQKFSIKITP